MQLHTRVRQMVLPDRHGESDRDVRLDQWDIEFGRVVGHSNRDVRPEDWYRGVSETDRQGFGGRDVRADTKRGWGRSANGVRRRIDNELGLAVELGQGSGLIDVRKDSPGRDSIHTRGGSEKDIGLSLCRLVFDRDGILGHDCGGERFLVIVRRENEGVL